MKLLIERGATVEGANGVSWCVILFLFLSLYVAISCSLVVSLVYILLIRTLSLLFLLDFSLYQHRPIYFHLSQSTDHPLFSLSLLPPLCHSLSLHLSCFPFFPSLILRRSHQVCIGPGCSVEYLILLDVNHLTNAVILWHFIIRFFELEIFGLNACCPARTCRNCTTIS